MGGTALSQPVGFWVGVGRQFDYWRIAYARTWRGTLASSFLSPIFYVLAMGVVLGGFITGDSARLEGATSYLAFVVPGLIAAQSMQTAVGETTYPVMSMILWQRVYHSMLATPLSAAEVATAHLLFVAFRLVMVCGVFTVVVAPFGVYATWWGALVALLAQVLVGMAVGSLVYALAIRMRNEEGFSLIFRLGVFPMFLFSGAFFPVSNLGEVGAFVARLTPLWHGVNLSRMFSVGSVDWPIAALNVGVLIILTIIGWRLAVTGLAKRLLS